MIKLKELLTLLTGIYKSNNTRYSVLDLAKYFKTPPKTLDHKFQRIANDFDDYVFDVRPYIWVQHKDDKKMSYDHITSIYNTVGKLANLLYLTPLSLSNLNFGEALKKVQWILSDRLPWTYDPQYGKTYKDPNKKKSFWRR